MNKSLLDSWFCGSFAQLKRVENKPLKTKLSRWKNAYDILTITVTGSSLLPEGRAESIFSPNSLCLELEIVAYGI